MAASTSKVEVALVSDEDIPTCCRILSESFAHNEPFIDAWFPHHETSSGQAQGTKRLLEWKETSPESTFLKAVTYRDNQEQIMGFAIWKREKEQIPAELDKTEDVEEIWPNKNDREYMARLWRDYVVPQNKAISDSKGKGVYNLELIAILPDSQRSGAGTRLVQWGTNAADEQGLQSVVVGTPVARRLYESCGMVPETEKVRFDIGEEFSGRRNPVLTFFKRAPKS